MLCLHQPAVRIAWFDTIFLIIYSFKLLKLVKGFVNEGKIVLNQSNLFKLKYIYIYIYIIYVYFFNYKMDQNGGEILLEITKQNSQSFSINNNTNINKFKRKSLKKIKENNIKRKTIKKSRKNLKKNKIHFPKNTTQFDITKFDNIVDEENVNESTETNCYSIVNTFPSNRSLLGVVTISVPYGIIIKTNHFVDHEFEKNFSTGISFLSKLCGSAAHNFLLNAFSGESNRVLYARFECLNGSIQPCELQCDFGDSSNNRTSLNGALTPTSNEPTQTITGFIPPNMNVEKVAKIYLLTIPSAFKNFSMNDDLTFFTRHNHSNILLYLDAKSIPYLGHFPSEMTGKSIQQFIYRDDQHIISTLHNLLRQNKNFGIIKTDNVRFITHSGHILRINSEWCGYVNPWNNNIEMVVGRHKICDDHLQLGKFLKDGGIDVLAEPNKYQTCIYDYNNFNDKYRTTCNNTFSSLTNDTYLMSQKNKIMVTINTDPSTYIQKNINIIEKPVVNLSTKQVQYLDNVHRYFQNTSQTISATNTFINQKLFTISDNDIMQQTNNNNNNNNNNITNLHKQQSMRNFSPVCSVELPLTIENLRNHTQTIEQERLKMWQERIRLMQRSTSNTPQSTISTNDIRPSTTDSTNAIQQED
ncbi:Period [Strongyloides ratti]|uniref:Period n=1 Tax=Strongyloides ratti TaxID=34506 RepID=A0A090MQ96_STRRB|nr:Period [Strongyloides ratti]CEF60333.1 Period [Strongyloides ratti]